MANGETEFQCDYQNCTSVSSFPGANIASPIIMSLVGILGNAIALLTVHRTKMDQHRTVFFVFVAGLAWADLIGIVLTTIPVILVYSHEQYIGGAFMCNYHAFTMITFALLTPLIVCAMALERLLGIRHAYFYMRHVNPTRARFVMLALWIVALSFASLPFFGFGHYAIQYPGTWCFLNIHPSCLEDSLYSIAFAIVDLAAIGVMIGCNIVVQCTLVIRRCNRTSMGKPNHFRRTHIRNRKSRELEIQMMVLLLAITLVFTLCWGPLQLVILRNQFYEHVTLEDHRSELFAVRLASVNQLLDPWVYILCKKLCFRKPCRKLCLGGGSFSSSRNRSQRELLSSSRSRQSVHNRDKHLAARQYSDDLFHQVNEVGKLNYDYRLENARKQETRNYDGLSSSESVTSDDLKPINRQYIFEFKHNIITASANADASPRRHSWNCGNSNADDGLEPHPRKRTQTNIFN